MKYKYILFLNLDTEHIEHPQEYVKCLGYGNRDLTLEESLFYFHDSEGREIRCGILYIKTLGDTFRPSLDVMNVAYLTLFGREGKRIKEYMSYTPGYLDCLSVIAEDVLVVDAHL